MACLANVQQGLWPQLSILTLVPRKDSTPPESNLRHEKKMSDFFYDIFSLIRQGILSSRLGNDDIHSGNCVQTKQSARSCCPGLLGGSAV